MWLHIPKKSGSSASAQASEVSTSEFIRRWKRWDSSRPLCATSSGKASLRPSSWRGWKRRSWVRHLSGLTPSPSRLRCLLAEWISSLEASPASLTRWLESRRASRIPVTSGQFTFASLTSWESSGSSLRTSKGSSVPSPESWRTLPKAGGMRSGLIYERKTLEHLTDDAVSSSWPTASATDSKGSRRKGLAPGSHTGETLTDAALAWPTPSARDWKSGDVSEATRKRNSRPLSDVVLHPTPTAAQYGRNKSVSDGASIRPSLSSLHTEGSTSTTRKVLNPRFVEWLMGYPRGWTVPSDPTD